MKAACAYRPMDLWVPIVSLGTHGAQVHHRPHEYPWCRMVAWCPMEPMGLMRAHEHPAHLVQTTFPCVLRWDAPPRSRLPADSHRGPWCLRPLLLLWYCFGTDLVIFLTENPESGPESMKMDFETTKMNRISPGIQWNTSWTPPPKKKKKTGFGG